MPPPLPQPRCAGLSTFSRWPGVCWSENVCWTGTVSWGTSVCVAGVFVGAGMYVGAVRCFGAEVCVLAKVCYGGAGVSVLEGVCAGCGISVCWDWDGVCVGAYVCDGAEV